MAKKCDFCGNNVSSLNEFTRTLDGYNCKLCEKCATSFDGLVSPSLGRYSDSLEWKKHIINENRLNPLIKDAFISDTLIRLNQDNKEGNSLSETTLNTNSPSFSQNGQSSLWIGILKIMAVLSVIVMMVVCGISGYFFLDNGGGAVLGILVGAVIGMISISVIMVFLNMAEDIKSNYAVNVNIQKTLEAILKKM